MTKRLSNILLVCAVVACLAGVESCGTGREVSRMTLADFGGSFATVFTEQETDSAGFDAMEALARDHEDRLLEITGRIEWDRPYGVKPESRDKPIIDLTFGDMRIDSAHTKFFIGWLAIEFQGSEKPYVGPELVKYGLSKSGRDYFPLPLPGEFLVTRASDTLRGHSLITVRGRVSIDWKRGLRIRQINPLKSISLKDCRIVDVSPPTP